MNRGNADFLGMILNGLNALNGTSCGIETDICEWVGEVRPTYLWYTHCLRLAGVLRRIDSGELKRVMVFMPPQNGKSELVSRLFSAWFLARHPEKSVGIVSYGADLAELLSRAARDNFKAGGGVTRTDSNSVKHWQTPAGGGLWCAGVGGPITGKGFDLGIIDDPFKNAEDASSIGARDKLWDWYASTFLTRQRPGAAIVVVQTRWHEDDLSGRLIADPEAGAWHVVNLPAIAEQEREWPDGWTVEPDWRQPGEPLNPRRYSVDTLAMFRRQSGERVWASLFQQRPAPLEGGMFKRDWLRFTDGAPGKILKSIRYWDRAATEDGGDYTVGVKMHTVEGGTFYIEDVVRGQFSTGQRDTIMRSTAEMDGRAVVQWTEQEPGSSGKDAVQWFIRLMVGFMAQTETHRSDKVVRAGGFASQCEGGFVFLKRASWNPAFLEELCMFPNGSHDDQVDAASGAFNRLCDNPKNALYSPAFAKTKMRT